MRLRHFARWPRGGAGVLRGRGRRGWMPVSATRWSGLSSTRFGGTRGAEGTGRARRGRVNALGATRSTGGARRHGGAVGRAAGRAFCVGADRGGGCRWVPRGGAGCPQPAFGERGGPRGRFGRGGAASTRWGQRVPPAGGLAWRRGGTGVLRGRGRGRGDAGACHEVERVVLNPLLGSAGSRGDGAGAAGPRQRVGDNAFHRRRSPRRGLTPAPSAGWRPRLARSTP